MPIKFISQEPTVKSKTIVLRCDLNSNVVDNNIVVSARLQHHAKTIKQGSDSNAKIVVLAHQGRKGDDDFLPLEQHALALEKLVGKKVKFVKWSDDYVAEIKNLQDSEIILMDNTRFLDEETMEEKNALEHSKAEFVTKIASVANYFVLDALSVAHRSHASVVGFTPLLPSFAGPCLEREIMALKKISDAKKRRLIVLGGAKPKESIEVLGTMLKNNAVDEALLGGVLAELFWKSEGKSFGAKDSFFEQKKLLPLLPNCAQIMKDFSDKIVLPIDFGIDKDGARRELSIDELPSQFQTMDIGEETIKLFCKKISDAAIIIFNGPMGVFEKKDYSYGTKKVLAALSKTLGFSLLGGGDTETALSNLGFQHEQFGHVSLAGKALLEYLAGKQLPGLVALEASK